MFEALLNVSVILLMILIHEYGHYKAMVGYGIYPKSLTVGLGPKIFWTTIGKGTIFTIRPIPLAGAVNPEPYDVEAMPVLQQLKICFWGVWYNILSAIPVGIYLAYEMGLYEEKHWLFVTAIVVAGTIIVPLVLWIAMFLLLPLVLIDLPSRMGEVSNVDIVTGDFINPSGSMSLSIQLLTLFYVFSVLMASMNLMPLSITDGGRILKALVHRRFPRFWKGYAIVTGFILAGLVILNIVNDVFGVLKLFQ